MWTPRTETRRFLGFDGIRFVVRSQTRPSMGWESRQFLRLGGVGQVPAS